MTKPKLIVDVETTGFESSDDITQISILILDENNQIDSYANMYCNTDKQLDPKVVSITGVNNSKLKYLSDNQYFEDIAESIKNCFDGSYDIIGHNISFDKRMIESNMLRSGIAIPDNTTICTMKSMTDVMKIKSPRGYKYPKLIEAFNFTCRQINKSPKELHQEYINMFGEGKAHNALYDCFMTHVIYKYLLSIGKG